MGNKNKLLFTDHNVSKAFDMILEKEVREIEKEAYDPIIEKEYEDRIKEWTRRVSLNSPKSLLPGTLPAKVVLLACLILFIFCILNPSSALASVSSYSVLGNGDSVLLFINSEKYHYNDEFEGIPSLEEYKTGSSDDGFITYCINGKTLIIDRISYGTETEFLDDSFSFEETELLHYATCVFYYSETLDLHCALYASDESILLIHSDIDLKELRKIIQLI